MARDRGEYDRNAHGEVLPPGPDNENRGDLRADGGREPKAYLPPEGPQSVHGVRYQYNSAQGAHRIGNVSVYGEPGVILTSSEQVQREAETWGLEELPDDVTDDLLEANAEDDTDRVAELVDDYRRDTDDVAPPEEDRPDIPEDLDGVPYRGEDDETDLQDLAQAYGIPANQKAGELRTALADARADLLDSEGGTTGEEDDETLDSEGGTRGEAEEETLDSEGDGGEEESVDEEADG